ncbi:alpha/beta hydrolase [Coraliomargarita sp. SDUM461004]|uniref:Alpha/beta hydrolase n=1 Tax=Thalassobacterium sedimentorum TaxID=3041258 RepID=A0ABU1ANA1_9BACT|nr:alpha/beta hydrolase [Coraliomargarita sp. SDUM461004]MDQ8195340.1 alpha/beta hydrolase [Coraliomargarita sp. SDUM461004]
MQTQIKVFKDIPFLGIDREEKMDAYLPENATSGLYPAVLLIHGGGWRLLDKASEREVSIAHDLAKAGFVVFSINYLLNVGDTQEDGSFQLTKLAWPTNLYDCKTGLRFIRKFSSQYNVDPNRIAVMGASAGAHLAMMLGSTVSNEELNQSGLYTDESNAVSCVVNLYGDYDIRGRKVSPFEGATPEETKANEREASPVTWIDSNMPPMLIAHGARDEIIPVERSRLLVQHLKKLNLNYLYLELSKDGHSFDFHPQTLDLATIVIQFLNQYLKVD